MHKNLTETSENETVDKEELLKHSIKNEGWV
jgi:hypothetical protein